MNTHKDSSQAQILLPSTDLNRDMDFFHSIGFRLEHIYPDDNPQMAVMSGHGMMIRLDTAARIQPPFIYLLTDEPTILAPGGSDTLTAPNGCKILLIPKTFQASQPATKHRFEIRKLENNEPWVIGRAGMLYRDLIPGRLGGSIMASHISIPNGGPVPDMVHYHTIGFQLIFCYRGWVSLVYEDQGDPFVLHAGECVTQPPEIRHRVLEASDHLEVIEIGIPAEHMTTIDHEMELPTGRMLPDREYNGQTFCHHKKKDFLWKDWILSGFEERDSGVSRASGQMAGVSVIRAKSNTEKASFLRHNADIYFGFAMSGKINLQAMEHPLQKIGKGDAFVIPPGLEFSFSGATGDFEMLIVSLPGNCQYFINNDAE